MIDPNLSVFTGTKSGEGDRHPRGSRVIDDGLEEGFIAIEGFGK